MQTHADESDSEEPSDNQNAVDTFDPTVVELARRKKEIRPFTSEEVLRHLVEVRDYFPERFAGRIPRPSGRGGG